MATAGCVFVNKPETTDAYADNLVRVVIAGAAGVGKTSLLNRIYGNEHTVYAPTTSLDFFVKYLHCADGRKSMIQFFDVPGNERNFTQTFSGMVRHADVVLLVTTADANWADLDAFSKWKCSLDNVMQDNYTCCAVANKMDAVAHDRVEQRKLELKRDFNNISAFDGGVHFVSARSGENCRELVYAVVTRVLDLRAAQAQPPQKPNRLNLSTPGKERRKCCH